MGKAAAADNAKEDKDKKDENLSSHAKRIKRFNTRTEHIEKEILSKKTLQTRGREDGKDLPSDSSLQSTP